MVNEKFVKLINSETPQFKAIINILSPEQEYAKKGRKLLCLVDHIIDYYIEHKQYDVNLNLPIIYFPVCESWAQELCENFVALKMALLFGNAERNRISEICRAQPYLVLPSRYTPGQKKIYIKMHEFLHRVGEYLTDNVKSYNVAENQKCLIFSKYLADTYKRCRNNRNIYHFVKDIIGIQMSHNRCGNEAAIEENVNVKFDRSMFDTDKSLILLDCDKEVTFLEEIEEEFDDDKNESTVQIPDIFMFIQKNADGHIINFCRTLGCNIKIYNEDYDTSIHNVFFFMFSCKPYRLQRIYETKHNLVGLLQKEKVNQTKDFISFTREEMDYLFNRTNDNERTLEISIDESEDEQIVQLEFDYILQDISHEMKIRNEIAICYTDSAQTKIKEDILNCNNEANESYIDLFLNILKAKQKDIEHILQDWCSNSDIAVVLDYNIDQEYISELRLYLELCGAKMINFYTFKDFKVHKENSRSEYKNSINENKIIVFSMLNHCSGLSWAIYPNSFDQMYLNKEQTLLFINNKFVFEPRYSWYQYNYDLQKKYLLGSDFRNEFVKNKVTCTKPAFHEIKNDTDEQSFNLRQYDREQVRYKISFGTKQHITLLGDDLLICKQSDDVIICTASYIKENFDELKEIEVQPLEELYKTLENFADTKQDEISSIEISLRNDIKFALTDDEINSSRELWKILLTHRVNELGETTVYNDIMNMVDPIYQIQLNSFRRWLDIEDSSILPRSRHLQKQVLEKYLNIDPLYTRILRNKKSRSSTNTEGRNKIFKNFITSCLLADDYNEAYESLSYEVIDYFNIENAEDVRVLVDMIKEDSLNLRKIKNIIQQK